MNTCAVCGQQSDEDKPPGWLIRQKTYGEPGEMFVVCNRCLTLGSATLDVVDSAPFRKLEREVRRVKANGDNQRIRNATNL